MNDIIRIYNADLDGYAKVSQKAFDTGYAHDGWVIVGSARDEAKAEATKAKEDAKKAAPATKKAKKA